MQKKAKKNSRHADLVVIVVAKRPHLTYHLNGEDGFVPEGQLVVEGHDDAVGNDGDDDGPFEDRPVDEPGGQPSHGT